MKKKTSNPNAHKRIINSLKRIPESIWTSGIDIATKKGGEFVWQIIKEMQEQNADHPEAMKKILGRSYGPIMKYKPRVKKIGKNIVRKLPGDKNEIRAHDTMKEQGLNKLLSSKKYSGITTESREFIKEGSMKCFCPVFLHSLPVGKVIWMIPPAKGNYVQCIKTEAGIRVIETSQVFIPKDGPNIVLIEGTENYSLTIKQIPRQSEVIDMAKAKVKKATKKTAVKKTAVKKGSKKPAAKVARGEGKIAEIIALHKKGLTNVQIIEKGYNKSTVGIQVAKYKRGDSNYK